MRLGSLLSRVLARPTREVVPEFSQGGSSDSVSDSVLAGQAMVAARAGMRHRAMAASREWAQEFCPDSVRGPSLGGQRQPSAQNETGRRSVIQTPSVISAALAKPLSCGNPVVLQLAQPVRQ